MINSVKDNGLNPCTGCGICEAVCPKDAIIIKLNNEGFYEPTVKDELCVNCGICKKSCYKYSKDEFIVEKNNKEVYSCINKDKEELYNSSSGGVASVLAKELIKQGYKVLGVSYDYNNNIAVTEIASEISEINRFRGSKYFQSYTVDAFRTICNDKSKQKYAVFGTPCQIYGLYKFADKNNIRDRFLFVDIFCHGCPSLNLWKKYYDYVKKKTKQDKFEKIDFRSKINGWHEYSFCFKNKSFEYKTKKNRNYFYTLFFDKMVFGHACYECKTRSSLEFSDIRLGDFWGSHYDTDRKGVSAVIVSTKRGSELFNSIRNNFFVKEHKLEDVVSSQTYGKNHHLNKDIRIRTLDLLSSDMDMKEIIKKYKRNYSFAKKLKIVVKSLFSILPQGIYFRFKKLIHMLNR